MPIRISPCVRPICCEPVDSTHPDTQGIAGLSRDRAAKDPELLDARAQLAVQNIINFVTKTLEKAPPISAEQRQRITALFEAGAK